MSHQTEHNKTKVLAYLKEVPVVVYACKKAGIGTSTYYRWLEEDKAFYIQAIYACDEGKDNINNVAENNLIKGVYSGQFQYIKYWLEHNHSDYIKKEDETLDELFRALRKTKPPTLVKFAPNPGSDGFDDDKTL